MQDGKIQSLVAEKGFGFIEPAAGGANVFFHHSVTDAPFETLTRGQTVKYELDSSADKPRARCVKAGETSAPPRSSPKVRSRDTRRVADCEAFEHGFVTKLHHKKFRGFISSIKHGPEYLFVAGSVSGEKRFSGLEIGDYVQFLVAEPDPADPKQPVAKAVKVVKREVKIRNENQLGRHPKARKKKADLAISRLQ